jgi:basic membrane lipoprotein Med (substrate-binding protein (PBP1-ABC) superfamily)
MKEYKLIPKSIWKKDLDFEDTLNQLAREGWEVISAIGNGHGRISKVILEREKNRTY